MKWFSDFQHRRQIRKYVRRLGPRLEQRYGKSKTYTAAQVRKAAKREGLSGDYICYGYAAFLSADAFDQVHREMGQACDYAAMRQEIADLCFSGNSDFTHDDAVAYGEASGGGFDGDSGGDGGGVD